MCYDPKTVNLSIWCRYSSFEFISIGTFTMISGYTKRILVLDGGMVCHHRYRHNEHKLTGREQHWRVQAWMYRVRYGVLTYS